MNFYGLQNAIKTNEMLTKLANIRSKHGEHFHIPFIFKCLYVLRYIKVAESIAFVCQASTHARLRTATVDWPDQSHPLRENATQQLQQS